MRVSLETVTKSVNKYWFVPFLLLLILSGVNLADPLFGSMRLWSSVHLMATYILIIGLLIGIYIDVINGKNFTAKSAMLILVFVQFITGSLSYAGYTLKMIHALFFWLSLAAVIAFLYLKKVFKLKQT
jgi:hypothetical protein